MNTSSGASSCCPAQPSPAQPSPAQPSPAQPKRAITLLLALALGLSAIQAHAAFEVRHYFGSSASHSSGSDGDVGNGTAPGEDVDEEPGAQRVVEFSSNGVIRFPQDIPEDGNLDLFISGRVADNNNNFDPSLSEVTIWCVECGGPAKFPLDGNGMFEEVLQTFSFSAGDLAFPGGLSYTLYAAANEEDPGKEASITITEGRTLEVSHIEVIDTFPGIMPDIKAQIEILGAPGYCIEGEVQINWSTTFGELTNTTTYLDESCQTMTSISHFEEGEGPATVTAQVVGWGDHQHSITIDEVREQ